MKTVRLDDRTIAYREAGSGPAVLLLHGWPTSSFLWRDVIPHLAARHRVIAPDLPGFGASDKPLDVRYGFGLFDGVLDGLLGALEVDRVALVVHDLGGPIGLHWALARPERLTHLVLLNTLVYPEFSPAVQEFVMALASPQRRGELTSPEGLTEVLRLGLAREAHLTDEVLAGVLAPLATDDDRQALARAGIGLELDRFAAIARGLPTLDVPVRVVYGERDRILPDVAETMARVARDLPQAEVTALPGVGHFLHEEAPAEVGRLLAAFLEAYRDSPSIAAATRDPLMATNDTSVTAL
ncbi:MAG: alpha/beta fold hydrolase [Solirubrobacterales bacterium]|nr:alpha/beta fold hydrolase [Solirubrobacterales bacterium]